MLFSLPFQDPLLELRSFSRVTYQSGRKKMVVELNTKKNTQKRDWNGRSNIVSSYGILMNCGVNVMKYRPLEISTEITLQIERKQ